MDDWVSTGSLREALADIGPLFARRAAALDETDGFARETIEDLRGRGILSAMVPQDLGGGGQTFSEMCAFLTRLAGYCPSSALVVSMHQHVLASAIVNDRLGRPGRALLEKVGRGNALIITTVANDWLESNGCAREVAGGYEVTAQKHFVSGAPAGDILVSSARVENDDPSSIIHFAIPMNTDGVVSEGGWRAHGMRATGTERICLTKVFVPQEAVTLKRSGEALHPVFYVVLAVAPTLIMACYAGIAARAREIALEFARQSEENPATLALVSELEITWSMVEMAHRDMVSMVDELRFSPSVELLRNVLSRKAIVASQVLSTCEKAVELAGGAAFLRNNELERLLRDVRAAQFHPLNARQQPSVLGRLAMEAATDRS